MSLEQLRKRLIETARRESPAETVPYAFEKRIMARLREKVTTLDPWALWNRMLWRASVPCVVIALAISVIAISSGSSAGAQPSLALDLEETVLAPLASVEVEQSW